MKLAALAILCALAAGGALMSLPPARESMSGGVVHDRTDHSAPKAIVSREITELSASFWLEGGDFPRGAWTLHASRDSSDTIALSVQGGVQAQAFAEPALLSELQEVIERFGLVKRNGVDRVTSGLPPEYSPVSLKAEYASGERLYFRTNGSPRAGWPEALLEIFLREAGRKP